VGQDGLPDTYEQPRHALDLVVARRFLDDHLEIKGTATNLVDDDYAQTQGEDETDDNLVRSYSVGQTFTLGAALQL
jgi:hypothetical protein